MAETKPLTTANLGKAAEEKPKADVALKADDARPDAGKAAVSKPVPSQAKADDIREDATGAEAPKKAKDKLAKLDDPYPTQADLDAMRAGTFKSYETR